MKSNASDQIKLVECIYRDASAQCVANVSDLRDLIYIRSRVEKEGLSFLTITLPTFAADLEQALRIGYIDPTTFRSFRKVGAIPAFLQGMLGQLFNRESGRIYDDHSQQSEAPVIVESIRQICLAFKKTELPCTSARTNKALANYIATEYDNQQFSPPKEDVDEFRRISFILWSRMLGRLRLDMLLPRHGPGATAERISGNQKYVWRRWHERLEPFVPFFHNAYVTSAVESREFEEVEFVSQDNEDPVRIITVPKTDRKSVV